MKKPQRRKVQFGICDKCFRRLKEKGDLLLETFLDICIYHIHTKHAISSPILEDRYPIHIEYILRQLENENYITSHENEQGLYVLPRLCLKNHNFPIYCTNNSLECSKIVLEQNHND